MNRTLRESDDAQRFIDEFTRCHQRGAQLLDAMKWRISRSPFCGYAIGGEPPSYVVKSNAPGLPVIRMVYCLISDDLIELKDLAVVS